MFVQRYLMCVHRCLFDHPVSSCSKVFVNTEFHMLKGIFHTLKTKRRILIFGSSLLPIGYKRESIGYYHSICNHLKSLNCQGAAESSLVFTKFAFLQSVFHGILKALPSHTNLTTSLG